MNPQEALKKIETFDTSSLSDALDRLGINGQCHGIQPLDRSFRVAGRAFTLLFAPHESAAVKGNDYIDDLEAGTVVVIDNQGNTNASTWGDILTSVAHRRGLAGTVIDGISRDVDRSIELNYPIFSRGTWMRTGKDRVSVVAQQVAVVVGGVTVNPGDYLKGDGDGVVVIPADRVEEVLKIAAEIAEAEDAIRKAVDNGKSLKQARADYGYYQLQAKQK